MKPWEGVIKIPESRCGGFAIVHETRKPGFVPRSSPRSAVIGGQGDPPLYFGWETTWHKLVSDEHGTWMTDLPIEQCQIDQLLRGMRGTVLVGGLGLGYAATVLAQRKSVKEVLVVERQKEVIDLVLPHLNLPQKVRVVQEDLFRFLRGKPRHFDFAFFDIWQGDGETDFHEYVVPLRAAVRDWCEDDHVQCWNENVMRGQLRMALISNALLAHELGKTFEALARAKADHKLNWPTGFFAALRDKQITLTGIDRHAGVYAWLWGRPGWATKWKHYLENIKS